MTKLDLLYRIAVWNVDRERRELEERDYIPSANARLQRWVAEAWRSGKLTG